MALSVAELKSIFEPISAVGRKTVTFSVGSVEVRARVLLPAEEIEIQRYARGAATEGDTEDAVTVIEYLDRLREATIGFSIVSIGGRDFSAEEFIETDEVLPSGVRRRIPRHEAIISIVHEWGRNLSTAIFRKIDELLDESNEEVEKAIQFDEKDADAEIARLEEKIEKLRSKSVRERATELDPRDASRARAADRPLAPPTEAPAIPSGPVLDVSIPVPPVERTVEEVPAP